jgi:chaperonin GroES
MKKKAKAVKKSPAKKTVRASAPKTQHAPLNKTGVAPLGDRVVVRPLSPDEIEDKTTSFGIIIPDTVSKDKPEQGEVIAVGEGKWDDGKLIKPTVKVGDRVVFSKYGYDEIKIGDKEYYILREDNILAIIH